MPAHVTRFSSNSLRDLVSTVNEFLADNDYEPSDVQIQFITTVVAGQTQAFIALITHPGAP
jgi:hypothetical protein